MKYLILATTVLLAACATHAPLINDNNIKESRIEISYVLGHISYKYIATALGERAEIASLREDTTLEKKSISLATYQNFASKVENIFKLAENEHQDTECRTPYKIEVFAENQIRIRSGCRSSDHGDHFGNIIKEGEYLFYSQK